jgi:hypothetical protein
MPGFNPPDGFIPLEVGLAAPAALAWLEADQPARPLHVFERVCNLIHSDGAVMSLMLAPVEMSPLALVIEHQELIRDFRGSIDASSPVRYQAGLLSLGLLEIHLDSATLWPPRPKWQKARASRLNFDSLHAHITTLLQAGSNADSLSLLLMPGGFTPAAHMASWMQHALDPIHHLLKGLEELDAHALRKAAETLAGLGLGLTPSGDDFIIGVMHALWITLGNNQAQSLCGVMLQAAAPRTNVLSANYLKMAARGEASEAWHTIALAFAQNDTAMLNSAVEKLINLGHTSGQDALSGFLLALAHIPSGSP